MKNKITYWALGIMLVYTSILFWDSFVTQNQSYSEDYITLMCSLVPLIIVAGLTYWSQPKGGPLVELGYMMLMCIAVTIEAFLLFIFGWGVRGRRIDPYLSEVEQVAQRAKNVAKGKIVFLTLGIVLLVGGSLCFGGAYTTSIF